MMNILMQQFAYQARWSEFAALNFEERVVVRSISYTFLFYLIGALYLVAPVVGWTMICVVVGRWAMMRAMGNDELDS